MNIVSQVTRFDLPTAAALVCTLCVALISGCDTREQKPKVESSRLALVSSAAALEVDRVVPPAAISGAMQPVDEAFVRFAASSGLAEIERYAEQTLPMLREHMSIAPKLLYAAGR